jgi:lipid-binding SYLF domain-containing protein
MTTIIRRFAPFIAALVLAACAINPSENQKDASRKDIREMASATLAQLYKTHPGARRHVEGAYGHAVFTTYGLQVFFAGGGLGQGIAVKRDGAGETFMKMVEAQAGLGLGARKFRLVWVFETASAYDTFVNKGWELGAQAAAAAAKGAEGGALEGAFTVSGGVWLYQLTEAGLALELTARGTKYYRDSDLNH